MDYIAGTSMGGLVGGFYASGMTPGEIHHLVDTLDWTQFVTAATDDRKLSFRRKEDVRDLGDENSLGLRHGLIFAHRNHSGQQLDLLLSQVAAPYDPLRSFSDLPTPFRCVATDLGSATAHIFDKGSLLQALRSTMSLPGIFDPVIDGKHEYVDGGLLDNLPVDQVMIRRGFAGAEKKSAVLSKFALNDFEWAQYIDGRQTKRKTHVPDPAFVDVKGVDGPVADAIRGYFIKDVGQPYDHERVSEQVEKAMANNVFAYMAYDLTEHGGETELVIYVRAAPSKPPALQPAVLVDGSDYRNSRFDMAGRFDLLGSGRFPVRTSQ